MGSSDASTAKASAAKKKSNDSTLVNKSLLSIDYDSELQLRGPRTSSDSLAENLETVDYLKPGDVGFKKPKVSVYNVTISPPR